MLRTSLIASLIGVGLGIFFGAVATWFVPSDNFGRDNQSIDLAESVNQRTGQPQVHLQGKPEIK